MLTARKEELLRAILMDFIANVEPVGSRTLTKKYNIGLSPATIRNEMADLEEMGYLIRPHASAGRIPTEKAYRLYVNKLMQEEQLTPVEKQIITGNINDAVRELKTTIKHATKLLSELTNLTSFAVTPKRDTERLANIDLLPLDNNQMVLVLLSQTGRNSTLVIRNAGQFPEDALKLLSRVLTIEYRGKTITESLTLDIADEIKKNAPAVEKLFDDVSPRILSLLKTMSATDVYMDGLSNIFSNPEYTDANEARNFIETIQRKEEFAKALSMRDDGIIVTIGNENKDEALKNCSLITATYHVDGECIGKIGVIGPTRMRYGHVTSVIKYLTDNVEKVFRDDLEPD